MLSPRLQSPSPWWFLCLFSLLFSGCAAMHSLKQNPTVSIADIRVHNLKAMETVFQIQLRILNPNDKEIELEGISCEMLVDGRHFANGIADANQSIPPYGSTVVTVNVYASVLDMVSSVMDLLHSSDALNASGKPMAYVLKGHVNVGVYGFTKEVPFTTAGEVSLKGVGRGVRIPGR